MLRTVGVLILLASLLGLISPLITPVFMGRLPTLAWLFDLASHWQWLYMLLLILSSLLLAFKQKGWLLSLIALALPFFTASPVLNTAINSTKPSLTLLSSNLLLTNSDLSRIKGLIDQEQPDAIVLAEFANQHVETVKAWADYPYQILQARSGAFGMAILSRLPLSNTQTITDPLGIEHISTQIAYTQPIQLIGFHPLPPVDQKAYQIRDELLQQLTNDSSLPILIAGDFNATPWSSAFTGLADKGFKRSMNLFPTWPANFKGFMGIPIDQVLASSQWTLGRAKIGDAIGSDHYPIVVELSL
ncbi:MAG: endonuclease/exonuclease/phosphatase family protein [Thiolinea sp.]